MSEPAASGVSKLSRREEAILVLTMSGLTDKEVAAASGLSIHTVRTYWDRIREKVGATSRSEAVATFAAEMAARENEANALDLAATKEDLAQYRKRAEDLAAQKAALEEIVGRAPQMTWASWPNGDIFYANDRYYQYTGLSPDEHLTVYSTWDELVLPEDRAVEDHQAKKNRSSGLPVESEVRVRRRDGVYRWHLIRSIPILDEQGVEVRWIGTAIDIHDLKERSSTAANIERRLQLICELAPVGIAFRDPYAGAIYSNDVFERIAGFKLTDGDTSEIWDWVAAEDRERVRQRWRDAVRRGIPFQGRVPFVHANGKIVRAQVQSMAIRQGDEHAFVMLVNAEPAHPDEMEREKLAKLAALLEDVLESSGSRF